MSTCIVIVNTRLFLSSNFPRARAGQRCSTDSLSGSADAASIKITDQKKESYIRSISTDAYKIVAIVISCLFPLSCSFTRTRSGQIYGSVFMFESADATVIKI